jgi:predicted O-linked N-acetylglucosamine transferase (SPINDLY family)
MTRELEQMLQLAMSRHQSGELAEAERLYRQILEGSPQHPFALHFLGALEHQLGNHQRAVELMQRALAAQPAVAMFHSNLAEVYRVCGDAARAVESAHCALRLQKSADAYHNLGLALADLNRVDEAIVAYRSAIQLQPAFAKVHNALGAALQAKGDLAGAMQAYRDAIAADPGLADAHSNLGTLLETDGDLDGAEAAFRKALELDPSSAETHNNLAHLLQTQGLHDEAIRGFREAIRLSPELTAAQSNLLYLLNFTDTPPAEILAEHVAWGSRHEQALAHERRPHENTRDPHRSIVIGYVSPDFYDHPAGRFMLPILQHRDRESSRVICYYTFTRHDAVTAELREHADDWRDVPNLGDGQLAELVRRDRVDVLIDLSLHSSFNRLLTFARQPAPVQATYLAYPGTSGLSTIDYRLTDPQLDPPAKPQFYSERSLALPRTYWCYRPHPDSPAPAEAPMQQRGFVCFGCLNNFTKVTTRSLEIWADILREVGNSRLLLHYRHSARRQRVLDFFEERGIHARVDLLSEMPLKQYFAAYQQIDIALDPIPYNGGTTTCDALWMGVPVVSLAGNLAVHRAGASLLANVGLPELVAHTSEDYRAIAVGLARDPERLLSIRSSLRERMRASPLMDEPRFASDFDAAIRSMWIDWCAT